MLFGITILRLVVEAKRLNAMSSACQCMSPRIVPAKMINDCNHLNTVIRNVHATASNQIGKLLKIALRCVFMWHDTSPRCTLSTLASLFDVRCTTVLSVYVDYGARWMFSVHARLMAGPSKYIHSKTVKTLKFMHHKQPIPLTKRLMYAISMTLSP